MTQDEKFQQAKAEASRLKSLLKAAEKERAALTDPADLPTPTTSPSSPALTDNPRSSLYTQKNGTYASFLW